MSKHASAEEKLRLIKLYYESGQTIEEFTNQHGVYISTFNRWLAEFRKNGEDALKTRSDKAFEKISPQLQTEADLRKEILKLRIENERLKKSYTVRTTEDGKTEYIRLKAKNTK